MAWKTLDDMNLAGKRVLVRVDINVPVADGKVTDTTRIDRIVPTVQDILAKSGKPILLAHFGRPKGKVVPEMSLEVVTPALSEALGLKVAFADGGWNAAVATLSPGQVLLLENMRFFPGEEANDPEFAKELAALGDIYCNDAFSAAHRAHASTEGVAHLLPNCVGRNMQEELEALEGALGDPIRPVAAVVGGAKVSTKITLLSNLLDKVDHLIIGGGMANTFLLAQGHEIGQSLAEAEMTGTALEILEKAKGSGCQIHLPVDVVVAEAFKARAPHRVYPAQEAPAEGMILDAGPKTVANICALFDQCETVVWNGPLGAFEIMPFGAATYAAARHAGALTDRGALITVAGGGDTVAALNNAKASYQFTYISTAGGAFLEWMEGKTLPGVAALGG